MRIRSAMPEDLQRLREIERAAGSVFRSLGMDAVADDEPPALSVLRDYQRSGCCWVAVDLADEPVAYVVVDVVDGAAHVEQVSVHPQWARQRLGARLIETVGEWARARGLSSLTLTTFADVPWNGPYYARLGFQVVALEDQSPGLRHIRAAEGARGLDRWPRVVMRRDVSRPRPVPDEPCGAPSRAPTMGGHAEEEGR